MNSLCTECRTMCYHYSAEEVQRWQGDRFDIVTYRYHFRCNNCQNMFNETKSERECANTKYTMDEPSLSSPARFGT